MQIKLTLSTAGAWMNLALGAAMLSPDSAATTELSPQDRCAIAKLEAIAQEAKCLTDAQIRGIRRNLSDREVDRQSAICRQQEQQAFKNAQQLPGPCKTVGDAAAVDYGLNFITDIPRACGESGTPCNAQDPSTLADATLRNRTNHIVYNAKVHYSQIPILCPRYAENFNRGNDIGPGLSGSASAGVCLITDIEASVKGADDLYIKCQPYHAFPPTGYRTFQVVLTGERSCVVNRP